MNPQLIAEVAALVAQLGPLAVTLVLKLESLGTLGPDEKANVANAIVAAQKADSDTILAVAQWMAKNGFQQKLVFVPATPAPQSPPSPTP